MAYEGSLSYISGLSVIKLIPDVFLFALLLADIQQLEAHVKNRKQREQEAREPLVVQLQQMIDGFQSSTDQLTNNITANVRAEVQHQVQMMVGK